MPVCASDPPTVGELRPLSLDKRLAGVSVIFFDANQHSHLLSAGLLVRAAFRHVVTCDKSMFWAHELECASKPASWSTPLTTATATATANIIDTIHVPTRTDAKKDGGEPTLWSTTADECGATAADEHCGATAADEHCATAVDDMPDADPVPIRLTGRVKWFNNTKGFGFITLDHGGADVFVHQSDLYSPGQYRTLMPNQQVEFQLSTHRSAKPQAVHVTAPGGGPLPTRVTTIVPSIKLAFAKKV